ncbi:MAG: VWA domain-containing protein [Pseudobdellovibrionaceae bacterium]|nr:VWA domain-containing protein [Bdellovibrionales bacterium]USN47528.1 MAG: VWA domain-containing protein [Pseudobdellovibrionaceae bacterium]
MIYRFADPNILKWLWLVPVIVILAYLLQRWQQKKFQRVIGGKLSGFLLSSVSQNKRRIKLILESIVVVLFILALARPQSGERTQKIQSQGVELMLLVDVSESMLAEDVKPSRMDLAKTELVRLSDSGGGDRMGVIAFAGSAILLSPVTPDKSAINMYLDSLGTNSVSTQGTSFKEALQAASDAFKRGGIEEDEKSVVTQAVVMVSDGENHDPGAIEIAEKMASEGVHIFTLAVGTEKGGAIPLRQHGQLKGYKKDSSGQVVMTQTSGEALKAIAQAGKGSFYHLTFGGNAISNLRRDLDQLEKSEFDSAEVSQYDENYQWPLGLAIVLALIELLLGERRPEGRIWKGRFEVTVS